MDDDGTGGACAREMPVLHDLMRTEFTALHRLVGGVDPQDASRVSAVAQHIRFMMDLLYFHHSTEDDLIWPPLKQRARLDVERIQRMEDQHEQIERAVNEVRSATATWESSPEPATAAALTEHLEQFLRVLEPHLEEEERDVVPLIDQHFSAREWRQVGDESFEKFTPAQRWIALGLLTDLQTPGSAAMLSELPAPVRILWPLVGRRRYRRYISPVRGTR